MCKILKDRGTQLTETNIKDYLTTENVTSLVTNSSEPNEFVKSKVDIEGVIAHMIDQVKCFISGALEEEADDGGEGGKKGKGRGKGGKKKAAGDKQVACTVCEYRTATKSHLTKHMRTQQERNIRMHRV